MTHPPFRRLCGPWPGKDPGGLLFTCDHAANAVPDRYDNLGLDPGLLDTHIAYDIGAAAVAVKLAENFASTAILARWSRLLIDLNRGEDDPTLVMKLSDGCIIPGNRDIDAAEIDHRIAAFHAPYHGAIAAEVENIAAGGRQPVLVAIHSFTPVWKGCKRIWQVAVLSGDDRRLAEPVLRCLNDAGFTVGDNEPYAGGLAGDTLDRHSHGRPHVLIEIRQDLIATPAAAGVMAARLEPVLRAALAEIGHPAAETTHSP